MIGAETKILATKFIYIQESTNAERKTGRGEKKKVLFKKQILKI